MKINQSNSNINQNPVLINTLVKQVSDLQIDTSEIRSDLTDLETAVNTHITFNRDGDGRTEVNNLASNDISVSKAAIQEANISHLTSANGSITNLTSTSGVIRNIQSEHISADDANITHLDVESQAHLQDTDVAKSLTVHGLTTTEDIHAKNIESISVRTTDVETTALDAVSGNIATINSQNITASNKVTTKDLEITGEITGVSDMEMHDLVANDIKANTADIDKITWIEQILDKTHVIDPSPDLGNTDRYTIQLPKFAGWYIITCLGSDNTIKWAATVRGNGYDYSISWFCSDTVESIKNLYQYKGQLYIRHAANGTIAFAYSADRDLPDPTIYFNMDGWTLEQDLPDLCDEKYKYDVITLSGTLFFGLVVIPKLETGSGDNGTINFKGSCTIDELPEKLLEAELGDVWNITDYGYTTADFVEGSGRPINIDDDVVAVKVKISDDEYTIKWNKFAAGVNYEDFRATKITAEEELISEGTLEVDGDSTFKGNIELDKTTSEISATGNIELTVAGTSTETYTGVKTENLTAGKVVNGDITQDGDFSTTGTGSFGGKLEADSLYGKALGINDTGTQTGFNETYMRADSHGVEVHVDTELSGDLTQTGDQNITGEVTISEKETINNLSPAQSGYYKKYDYWEDSEGNKIDQNLDAVENIIGTEKSRTAIVIQNTMADNKLGRNQGPFPTKLVCYEEIPRYFFFIENNGFEVIDGHPVQTSITRSDLTDNSVWVDARPNPGISGQLVITDNLESILEKNAVYLYRSGYIERVLGGNSAIPVHDPVIEAEVTNRQKTNCIIVDIKEAKFYKFALTQNGYEHVEEIDPHTYGLCPKGGSTYWNITSWVSRTFYYTPHQEFVQEADPNATYDENDEVLTVNGNENISRDIKVQGNIFGDQYHTAFLPNVTSTETNTTNLTANVAIIGDLD